MSIDDGLNQDPRNFSNLEQRLDLHIYIERAQIRYAKPLIHHKPEILYYKQLPPVEIGILCRSCQLDDNEKSYDDNRVDN